MSPKLLVQRFSLWWFCLCLVVGSFTQISYRHCRFILFVENIFAIRGVYNKTCFGLRSYRFCTIYLEHTDTLFCLRVMQARPLLSQNFTRFCDASPARIIWSRWGWPMRKLLSTYIRSKQDLYQIVSRYRGI